MGIRGHKRAVYWCLKLFFLVTISDARGVTDSTGRLRALGIVVECEEAIFC